MKELDGIVIAQLTGADPERSLRLIVEQGVSLKRVRMADGLTVRFSLSLRDYGVVAAQCARRGEELRIVGKPGLYWKLRSFLCRPVLVGGLIFLMALTLFLPTRVLFIDVAGNARIPKAAILEAAESSGLRFGVSRRGLRSEKIKNQLLHHLPELSWAGVNTSGCTAVITVREKPAEEGEEKSDGIASIVAARDGYILSCVTTGGNPLCAPGQTVRQGQTLISPYTDCGIAIRVTEAEGEVFAETRRKITALTPTDRLIRLKMGEVQKRYSLIFGKNRINLWKDSGICTPTCGRMYEEYYITLPGGFRLPVRVAVETVIPWETDLDTLSEQHSQIVLSDFAQRLCLQEMISGEILQKEFTLEQLPGGFRLTGEFRCREMIGRKVIQKIGESNG